MIAEKEIIYLDATSGKYHIWSYTRTNELAFMRCGVSTKGISAGKFYSNLRDEKALCFACLESTKTYN